MYISYYNSPLGKILLASDGDYLTGLWFFDQRYFAKGITDAIVEEKEIFLLTKEWLDLYFAGKKPNFSLPIKLLGSPYEQKVWQCLLQIPYGTTSTYGEIASIINSSPRAVGRTIGKNPISIIVPCHRVLGAKGKMTGYAAGIDKKKYLLHLESSKPIDDASPKVI